MDKKLFIARLRDSLSGLPAIEIEDILRDYEEHFRIGAENGKTEAEIAVSLGLPEDIARQYSGEQPAQNNSASQPDRTKMWIVGALLIALNVTLFLTPLLSIFWLWFALWAISFAAIAIGGAVTIIGLANITIPILNFLVAPFLALFGTGTLSLGIALIIIMSWLTKIVTRGLSWWVKFNIDIARKAGGVNA